MAVTTEPPWINKTSGISARNGTTTHSISLGFTPSSGSFLVFVVGGAVTNTNAGWTERAAPVNSGELSVFTKTSDGTETTFVDTVNGSNYPVVWTAYEFPTGTTWTGSVNATPTAETWQQITGLPGTAQVVFGAMLHAIGGASSANTYGAAWDSPWVEDSDQIVTLSGTDGAAVTVGHQINVTATSATPSATITRGGVWAVTDRETVTWALDVAVATAGVNAGADATATAGVLFSRTGAEVSLTSVTTREWTIVSGPAGVGSTIGTAAALSWTPTAAGSYVIRYSAVHSGGTATDDATITVINPTPTPVADRGTVSNLTTGTTSVVTLTNPTLIATGNYLVARVAADNSGTNGAAPGLTVADSRSNTWTVLGPALVDPGAANAGATAYICYAKVVTPYQAADTVTFTWGITTPGKSIVVEEWQYIHATSPVAVTATTATGTASSALSIGITPTAADQCVYTCLAVEGPTGDTAPTDADTTNGSWVALTRLATASGTAASNQTVSGAYKQVTASGAQTWDATITARDWAAVAVVFAPSPPPSATTFSDPPVRRQAAVLGALLDM